MSEFKNTTDQLPQNEVSLEESAFEVLRRGGDRIEILQLEMQYKPIMRKYGLRVQASHSSGHGMHSGHAEIPLGTGGGSLQVPLNNDSGELIYQLQLGNDFTRVFVGRADNWEDALKMAIEKAKGELTSTDIEKGKTENEEYDLERQKRAEDSPSYQSGKEFAARFNIGELKEGEVSPEQAAVNYLSDHYLSVVTEQLKMRYQPAMDQIGLTVFSTGYDYEGNFNITLRAGYNDKKTFRAEDKDPDTAFKKAYGLAMNALTPIEIEEAKKEREEKDSILGEVKEELRAPFRERIENIIGNLRG